MEIKKNKIKQLELNLDIPLPHILENNYLEKITAYCEICSSNIGIMSRMAYEQLNKICDICFENQYGQINEDENEYS